MFGVFLSSRSLWVSPKARAAAAVQGLEEEEEEESLMWNEGNKYVFAAP